MGAGTRNPPRAFLTTIAPGGPQRRTTGEWRYAREAALRNRSAERSRELFRYAVSQQHVISQREATRACYSFARLVRGGGERRGNTHRRHAITPVAMSLRSGHAVELLDEVTDLPLVHANVTCLDASRPGSFEKLSQLAGQLGLCGLGSRMSHRPCIGQRTCPD
jgi:hypothetical protein